MTDFENDNMDLEDLENDIIELIGDDGVSVPFEYLTTIEYEGKKYIALIPADEAEEEEEGEVVILEIQEDENGEDVYVSLDDDELLEKVFEEFLRIVSEQEGAEE